MRILVRLIGLFVLLTASSVGAQVSGRVVVVGTDEVERRVITDVLVFLSGVEGVSAPRPEGAAQRKATIESRDKNFTPRVAAIPRGATISFPNRDDIMHNVFSLSRGNRFDLGLYKSGAHKDFQFENPGLVRIYCNIHPQMSAFVHVMDNPYYTWAKSDGSFRIEGVPAGSYSLNVWNERAELDRPIVVTETGASDLLIELDVSRYQTRPHLNKFGKPYKRKRGKY